MRAFSLLLLLLLAIPAARAADKPQVDQLRAELDEMREKLRAPGGLVGVWRPGEEPLRIALGVANVETKQPMDPAMSFRVASLTKVFVGQVALMLAGEGKLSVDDPVSKYVPEVPNGDNITIWQLANHRSGLFNHIQSREVKVAFATEPERWWSEDELLAFCYKNDPYFPPGQEHHYSNANTVLLAKIIEKVTGEGWREQVEKRLLRPLALDHTILPRDNKLPDPHPQGYALGTERGPFFFRGTKIYNVTNTSPSWWGPAGSMISTIDDLARAANPLATGALIPESARAKLTDWTPADQKGYEYGFHIERVRGAIGHDGDVPGFQSVMLYFPKHDATVVAMVNLYGWSLPGMPADRLAWRAAETFGLAEPEEK